MTGNACVLYDSYTVDVISETLNNATPSGPALILPETLPLGWGRTFFMICISYFLYELVWNMTEPLFNSRTKRICDADSNSVFSNIYIFRNLAAIVANPLLSWLSDCCGRKPILLLGYVLTIVATWTFECASGRWEFYIAAVLYGCSPVVTVYVAIIGDMLPAPFRTRYICWLFAVGTFGTGIGAFGPRLCEILALPDLIALSTVVMVLAGLILLITPTSKQPIPKHSCGKKPVSASTSSTIMVMVFVLLAMVMARCTQYIEVLTRQNVLEHHYPQHYYFGTEGDSWIYKWLVLGLSFSRAIANLMVGWLVSGGEFSVASCSMVGLGIALLVSSLPTVYWVSSVMIVIFYALLGTGNPMFFAITSKAASSKSQGKMVGILGLVRDLSATVLIWFVKYLWEKGAEMRLRGQVLGAITPALIGTVTAIAASVFLLVAKRRSH
jgi:MFS family permease